MDTDRAALLKRLSQLWDEYEALGEADRPEWWTALDRSAPELVAPLRRMLSQDTGTDPLQWPERAIAGAEGPQGYQHQAGASIGPYRLLEPLGQGGLGEVWRAEREDGSLKRTVALKLPLWAQWSVGQRWRFERERDILAGLTHAHIARLYDAGVTLEGQSYLVMEVVEGLTITTHAQEQALGLAQRVALMLQVAAAVQYAHTQLVVHRDLKPANILVKPTGEPMVLDFGIGKLLQPDTDAVGGHVPTGGQTELTRLAPSGHTPDYAAPEQILQEPVSTATDVYALGVLLFELLSGTRPTQGLQPTEVLRKVLDGDDLGRPSQRVQANTAAAMGWSPRRLAAALRGDLDTIVSKAMRRQPQQRYPTVQALIEDLQRWQAGLPVLAMPQRWTYRSARFLRRNGWAVGGAVLAALSLAVGVGLTVWQARETTREAEVAKATEGFLVELLTSVSPNAPGAAKAQSMTVRELLDIGIAKLNADQSLTVPTRIRLLETLRQMLLELGDMQPAFQLQRTLTDLRLQQVPRLSVAHAQDLLSLAATGNMSVPRTQSDAWRAEAEAILDALGDHESMARAQVMLSKVMRVMFNRTRCVEVADEALAVFRLHPPSREMTEALLVRGNCLTDIARPMEGLQALEEGIAQAEAMQDNSKLRVMLGMRGRALAELDRPEEALRDARRSLAMTQALRQADELPSNTELLAVQQLGEALVADGQGRQALRQINDILQAIESRPNDTQKKGYGAVMPRLYAYQARLAEDLGDWETATLAARKAHASLNTVQAVNVQTRAWDALLSVQVGQGKFDEARATLKEAMPLFDKAGIEQTVQGRSVLRSRIRLALHEGNGDEAWRLWRVLGGLNPRGLPTAAQRPYLRTEAEWRLLELEILAAQGEWKAVREAGQALLTRLEGATPAARPLEARARVWVERAARAR